MAINWHEGTGRSARALIATPHLAKWLAATEAEVQGLGAQVDATTLEARGVADALLAHAADHDLLVVGCNSSSRTEGVLLGSIASAAVHRAPAPVLVARRAPGPDEFPAAILIALSPDGSEDVVTEAAARIARAHHARTAIVAPSEVDVPGTGAVVRAAVEKLAEATGEEPVLLADGHPAHRTIPRAAEELGASLVVMGSRGLTGVHALTSVSERVAHAAPCSVLIMRPRATHPA
jgi:nucleotide-binding universal stress UspA family protein